MKKLLMLLLLFLSTSINAVVTLNSFSSTNGEASSFIYSHTVSAGTDRIMIVSVVVRDSSATVISGVTYGGVSLTELSQTNEGGTVTLGIYSYINPPVGTSNVIVTLGSTDEASTGAITYNGTNAIGATSLAQTGGTSITNGITTTQTNSKLVNVTGNRGVDSFTADVNYTIRFNEVTVGNPANSNARNVGLDRDATTISTYNHTHTLGGFQQWLDYLVELKEAPPPPSTGPKKGSRSLMGIGR